MRDRNSVAAAPSHPQRRGVSKWPILGCGVLIAAVLVACGLGAADKAANAFMTNLKTANYSDAYALETPTLQRKFGGSVTAMEAQINKYGQRPSDWSFHSINVTRGVARLHGSVTYADGQKGAVDLELLDQNGKWSVAAVFLAK